LDGFLRLRTRQFIPTSKNQTISLVGVLLTGLPNNCVGGLPILRSNRFAEEMIKERRMVRRDRLYLPEHNVSRLMGANR